jgi:hypothetical protein
MKNKKTSKGRLTTRRNASLKRSTGHISRKSSQNSLWTLNLSGFAKDEVYGPSVEPIGVAGMEALIRSFYQRHAAFS